MPRVLVLHRDSLVMPGVQSLSVAARIIEVLDFLGSQSIVDHFTITENDPCAERAVALADMIVLSKHRSAKALELVRLAKRLGKAIVYDIDDWVFSFPAYSGASSSIENNHCLDIISLSDVVTVANDELMARLPKVIPNSCLVYLANGIWVERYEQIKDGIFNDICSRRIVFTNADFLKVQRAKDVILSALNVFFIRNPDYVLDFYGDPFPEMFSLPFLHFINRMPYQDYIRSLKSHNYIFAITPLGSHEDADSLVFNACKNPFKYINYSIAKIPGIFSSAKIYRDCIEHGLNGVLVENNFDSWLEAMELYKENANLRKTIASASFNHVKREYNIHIAANVFYNILIKLMKK